MQILVFKTKTANLLSSLRGKEASHIGLRRKFQRRLPETYQPVPPLHSAIWSKNHPLVRELLETGHNIGEEDKNKVTLWEYCIRSADVELAEILVDYMKKQKSPNHVGNTAFETALSHMTAFDYTDQRSWEQTVLICDMLLPFRRIFDPNLEFAKAESSICNYKKTFLIWVAEQGRIS